MCGIAVIFGEKNPNLLKEMMAKLHHRGPDEDGVYFSNNISMGHKRLSIIDVSSGIQPMYNDDKSIAIVFNGEIYNFKEIRRELEGKYNFKTNSDTEVILHLYEEKGTSCVNDLHGMFAFAIYDKGSVFFARDRIGIKPLFIAEDEGKIFAASEMKCLSFAKNIEEFPPGYIYTSEKGYESYYQLPSPKEIDIPIEEIITKIKIELEEAVKIRLVADVPVGVFLSGGLDSSVVAAVMKKHLPELHTFTVGVEGSNDVLAARKVASHIGSIHHEYLYTEEEMISILPKVIWHLESFDAPLVRSAVPNFFVSRLAHGIVKVLLSGEGADEIFCGYEYMKNIDSGDALNEESLRITSNLHNTNLQRTDRITMAHSIEARVPFLDTNLIKLAFSIPLRYKSPSFNGSEKWLLRKAFEKYLPEEIVWRKKQKFSDGAGSMEILKNVAEKVIPDNEYEKAITSGLDFIRSKEEFYYYKIFSIDYSFLDPKKTIGSTRDY